MKTTDLWAGKFGDEYIGRNRFDWRERVPFWRSALEFTEASTVFEFGSNIGSNLLAIKSIDARIDVQGCDINPKAVGEARENGLNVAIVYEHGITGLYPKHSIDLVFTAGVLIHIHPDFLQRTMQDLVDLSGRYVLAIEYHADKQEEVVYRGQKSALWKRPYGKLYQDMGLTLLSQGPALGFDKCEFYLLEKV